MICSPAGVLFLLLSVGACVPLVLLEDEKVWLRIPDAVAAEIVVEDTVAYAYGGTDHHSFADVRRQLEGADLVVSALGITRQRDGLSYRDVDYQANANLLGEALRAGVPRFGYVRVLHAEQMLHVPLVRAKHDF